MKKFLMIVVLYLFVTLQAYAQVVNGQFITNINGSKFEVTIAATMQSGTGSAGVVNIEFTYNNTALTFPASPVSGTDYVLQGGFTGYNTKNITRPSANSIRISLTTTGTPVSLSTSPVNFITLYFTINNQNATSDFVWTATNIAPVLLQPNYSVGTWANLAASLQLPSTDGQFSVNTNGTKYEVTAAVNMHSGTGSAGVVSIEFSFNTSALSIPMSPVSGTDYVLQGAFSGYNTKNITRPAADKIRISLVTTGTPVAISTSPTNIITLYFTILNAGLTSNLAWTKTDIAPVFLQANYAVGTWANLSVPLPVELTSFNASKSDGNIILKWTTATEVNNYGFDVERMTTPGSATPSLIKEGAGGGWEKIGFIAGAGNSNSPKEYIFIDKNPSAGLLQYRLKQIDVDGKSEYYSSVAEIQFDLTDVKDKLVPKEFSLFQNYPNPFNPSTVISFSIPKEVHVTLKVYSILGKEITTLVNENKQPGNYNITFRSDNLATGAYIYELRAGSFTSVKKLMVLK